MVVKRTTWYEIRTKRSVIAAEKMKMKIQDESE